MIIRGNSSARSWLHAWSNVNGTRVCSTLRRRTTDVFDTRWCFSGQWTAIFKRKPRLFGSSALCHLRNPKLARAESKERGKRNTRVERSKCPLVEKYDKSWQNFSTINSAKFCSIPSFIACIFSGLSRLANDVNMLQRKERDLSEDKSIEIKSC